MMLCPSPSPSSSAIVWSSALSPAFLCLKSRLNLSRLRGLPFSVVTVLLPLCRARPILLAPGMNPAALPKALPTLDAARLTVVRGCVIVLASDASSADSSYANALQPQQAM